MEEELELGMGEVREAVAVATAEQVAAVLVVAVAAVVHLLHGLGHHARDRGHLSRGLARPLALVLARLSHDPVRPFLGHVRPPRAALYLPPQQHYHLVLAVEVPGRATGSHPRCIPGVALLARQPDEW